MNFPIITNENFKEFKRFEGFTNVYSTNEYHIKKINEEIVFDTNYICCPCIYWVKKDTLWAFSFAVENIETWCEENGIILEERTSFEEEFGDVGCHFKNSIKRHYKYKGINYIEGWKKVILHSDGTFEKEDYKLPIFSLEIKDNYDLYKEWILKYKKIIKKINNDGEFIPTVTGGLDTRMFSCLYRDLSITSKKWYVRPVKQDGKNMVDKGLKEIEIANIIIDKIGLSYCKHIEELNSKNSHNHYLSLSGMFIENTRFLKEPNNPDWIYKYVQHAYGNNRKHCHLIMPYLDDMWLMFKQEHLLQRCLGMLLFAPDLLDVKLIGTGNQFDQNPEGYDFYEEYKEILPKAKEIMDYWGEEKCKNILVEDKILLNEIECDITNKCNLNCKGCGHFSPLYENDNWFMDVEQIKNDLKRLSSIFKLNIFKIMGGEPLLHPQIKEICLIVKKYIPEGHVWIVTNGILLNEYEQFFKENDIYISISKYPNIKHKIPSSFYIETDRTKMYNLSLDLKGKQEIMYNQFNCTQHRDYQLRNGRLYVCPTMLHLPKFLEHFNINDIKVSKEECSIDIYNNDAETIFLFLHDCFNFCKYCNIKRRNSELFDFDISKKDISEWIDES